MVCHNESKEAFVILVILVINQVNALNFCFIISSLHASTCFELYMLIIKRSQLYYTASDIITPVGDRPVHRLRGEDSRLFFQPAQRTATNRV